MTTAHNEETFHETSHSREEPAGHRGGRCLLRNDPRLRLGAGQDRRVHRARGHGRRRGPDGAPRPVHHRQAQPDEAVDGGGEQGRRRRRRGLPRREGRQGRPAQDHHHPLEPVHDADGDGRSVQLEGPHAGAHAGPRPVRPLGEQGQPRQVRQGVHRAGEEGRRRQDEDGRHGLQAGGPDHHRGPREADGRQVHLHPLQGRRRGGHPARGQAHRLVGQQPDRGRGPVARREPASPLCVFDNERMPYKGKVAGRHTAGTTSRPARKRASTPTT